MLYERRHTREITAYGGLARVVPVLSLIFVVTSLASIGLPGLNGFVGEFLVLLGSFTHPWQPASPDRSDLRRNVSAAAVQRIFFNKLDNPANEHLSDLTPRGVGDASPVFGMVWLGLYPKPVLSRVGGLSPRRADSAGQGALLRAE
jgi:NADH-quinone oxidoreductase subunit M